MTPKELQKALLRISVGLQPTMERVRRLNRDIAALRLVTPVRRYLIPPWVRTWLATPNEPNE